MDETPKEKEVEKSPPGNPDQDGSGGTKEAGDNFQGQETNSPNPAMVSANSSSSSSVSPTLPPPPLFVNALNLQPNTTTTDSATVKTATGDDSTDDDSLDAATLSSKFKEDPASILKLLQSSLSMEKLSSLVRSECRSNRRQLKSLQKQLEEAYVTLSDCATQKGELQQRMEESNRKIGEKRKQMESLREELRVLGEEELQLKKKRDSSYAKCADIKRKLKSSREAQQQIATFTTKTTSSSNSVP